jgi:hypothetical protein
MTDALIAYSLIAIFIAIGRLTYGKGFWTVSRWW